MKCWLTRLAVLLLLGAIVNVGVAWGCVLRTDLNVDPSKLASLDGIAYGSTQLANEPTFWVVMVINRPTFGYVVSTHTSRGGLSRPRSTEEALPGWSTLRSPSNWDRERILSQQEAAFGWPWLVLSWRSDRSFFYRTDPRIERIAYGLKIHATDSSDQLSRVLPLRAIWPGFVINTLFYAAILWLLAFGPFAARRFIRDKRGRCIKCGYDLRGTSGGRGGCPECGWRREAAA